MITLCLLSLPSDREEVQFVEHAIVYRTEPLTFEIGASLWSASAETSRPMLASAHNVTHRDIHGLPMVESLATVTIVESQPSGETDGLCGPGGHLTHEYERHMESGIKADSDALREASIQRSAARKSTSTTCQYYTFQ